MIKTSSGMEKLIYIIGLYLPNDTNEIKKAVVVGVENQKTGN